MRGDYLKMDDKSEKRLKELKKITDDKCLDKLLVEMVRLENELDTLNSVEKIRVNPECVKNPVKVLPAFYAYHKTLSAYKECIKLIVKQSGETDETSPLRDYLNNLKSRDTEEFD